MRTKVVHQTTRIWNHFPSNLKIPPVVSRRTLPGPLAAWHLLGPSRATWRPDDPWRWKEDDDWHVKDCGVVWTFANPTNKKQRSQSQSWNEKTPKLKIRKLGRWWKKLPKRVSEKKCLNIKKKKWCFLGDPGPLAHLHHFLLLMHITLWHGHIPCIDSSWWDTAGNLVTWRCPNMEGKVDGFVRKVR